MSKKYFQSPEFKAAKASFQASVDGGIHAVNKKAVARHCDLRPESEMEECARLIYEGIMARHDAAIKFAVVKLMTDAYRKEGVI